MSDERLIIRTLFGSHLYWLDTPYSDTDYKGIFMPTKEQVLLQQVPKAERWSTGSDKSRNTADDKDYEIWSLHEFLRLALKGETNAIDMLHAWDKRLGDKRLITYLPSTYRHVWYDLVLHRHQFYTSQMGAFMGYVRKQAAKYGVKGGRLAAAKEVRDFFANWLDKGSEIRLYQIISNQYPCNDYAYWEDGLYHVCGRKLQPTIKVEYALSVVDSIVCSYGHRAEEAKNNENIDWKAVSHALRAGYQLDMIFRYGDFEYPLPQSDFLMEVKQGKLDFTTEVQPILESLVEHVNNLADQSSLPNKPDYKAWNKWLVKVMEQYVL